MATETMIPILPCKSIDETLAFYVALGFAITYQQAKPNNYGCVQRGAFELHFFSMRDYEPANSYSSCYVRVTDVDTLYQEFVTRLRQSYGRLPAAGIPRVIPLKNKAGNRREFILIDPGGNWIRIGQVIDLPPNATDAGPAQAPSTKLSRATLAANFLAEHKGDYAGAAQALDAALWEAAAAPAVQRIPALVVRAGLAITMGDLDLGRTLLASIRQIPLHAEDQATLVAEIQTAADLEQMLP